MEIKQFFDTALAHASYAVVDNGEVAVIDPARDPQPYYDFAEEHGAKIRYVLETHPHADFVSSHLQIHEETGATILINELVGVSYPHQAFNHEDRVSIGNVTLEALHTPGHSPDSNSYLLLDSEGHQKALFTGDFLFIGDVGRPDLREKAGNIQEAREDLARDMYHSIHTILPNLSDEVIIYPTHGAGSLCGKNLSDKLSETLGNQRKTNWALQEMPEKEFIETLLSEQPYIPKYFAASVETNRLGAPNLEHSLEAIPFLASLEDIEDTSHLIVTLRSFSHTRDYTFLTLPAGPKDKFETWLGTILAPDEAFYLAVSSIEEARMILNRIAKIGYEKNVIGVLVLDESAFTVRSPLDSHDFSDAFVLDVREKTEHETGKFFDHAVNIPLSQLRERVAELPTGKPVAVHCAGGYRSQVAASIINSYRPELEVIDIGESIDLFK